MTTASNLELARLAASLDVRDLRLVYSLKEIQDVCDVDFGNTGGLVSPLEMDIMAQAKLRVKLAKAILKEVDNV